MFRRASRNLCVEQGDKKHVGEIVRNGKQYFSASSQKKHTHTKFVSSEKQED